MSTECRVIRQEYCNKNLLNYWCLPLTYLAISCPEHLKYKFYDASIFLSAHQNNMYGNNLDIFKGYYCDRYNNCCLSSQLGAQVLKILKLLLSQ